MEIIKFGLEYNKEDLLRDLKGIRIITKGNYHYENFNFCFLNDMLSQILQTLYEGYIPYIDLADRKLGENNWGTWFYQPYERETDLTTYSITKSEGRIDTFWGPMYGAPFVEYEYELTCKLYRDWVIIKDDIFEYIAEEYSKLIYGKRVLGVLCRGTDFTELKPQGHPVQPHLKDVIAEVRKVKKELNCEYIYLATEEKK